MHATGLSCPSCGWSGGLSMQYSCPSCGYSLEVAYDYGEVDKTRLEEALKTPGGVWSFRELLPVAQERNMVSLNEGGTPLIRAEKIFSGEGFCVYLKDETRNPTLSFKDRPNSVGISVAGELGFTDVAIASTGNGAASLAAYAAKAGMHCHVFVPEETPLGKVVQAVYHGADVIKTPGDYSASFHRADAECRLRSWANITSTYINPYTMEGDKTIAYEIFSQMGWKAPDWIVVPLGAGPMLSGILKGFEELVMLGFCDRLPRMAGVQAEGCAPIVRAFEEQMDTVLPWGECRTVAGAIADPLTGYEQDGIRTVRAIRKSDGCGIKVTDEEIMKSVGELAIYEAVLAEPASAASVAAVDQMKRRGLLGPGMTVVAMITAHGLKDGEALLDNLEKEEG